MFRKVSGGALSAWLLAAAAGLSAESGGADDLSAARRGVLPRPARGIARRRIAPARGRRASRSVCVAPARAGPDRASTGPRRRRAPPRPAKRPSSTARATNDNLAFFKTVFPPPDANGAAGPDHYFQAINLVFRIFDKDGNLVLGPLPNCKPLDGPRRLLRDRSSANTPLVKYDTVAGRWLVSPGRDRLPSDPHRRTLHRGLDDADPTGAYNQYDFVLDPARSRRASGIGIWPEGYYSRSTSSRVRQRGLRRSTPSTAARSSRAARDLPVRDPGATHSVDALGVAGRISTGCQPPPPGSPNVSIALGTRTSGRSPNDLVHIWRFHAGFRDPA